MQINEKTIVFFISSLKQPTQRHTLDYSSYSRVSVSMFTDRKFSKGHSRLESNSIMDLHPKSNRRQVTLERARTSHGVVSTCISSECYSAVFHRDNHDDFVL